MTQVLLCSNCFTDQGLRLDSFKIGVESDSICPNCRTKDGRKLDERLINILSHRFFVRGTLHRTDYGGAPIVQFNNQQTTHIDSSPWFEPDMRLIEAAIGVGFFYYGPRSWMIGEVEPLMALERPSDRSLVIERMLSEYPVNTLSESELFYRLRKEPQNPSEASEYDSPPRDICGNGRLDTKNHPVMYGSQDLEVCIHECRATVDDELFVATLAPKHDLKLLDLTELLQEDTTDFESLDIAVHMLFLADVHSYEISREIARSAHRAGFDGIIYPSYFSLVRTGAMPFDTAYGISIRKMPSLADHARAQTIRNLALFGRPIEEGKVTVRCINRVILNRVAYDIQFGPVGY